MRNEADTRATLIDPKLRGRDLGRWRAAPSAHILMVSWCRRQRPDGVMVQETETRRGIAVETMEKKYHKAQSYLAKFEKILRSRAAFKRYFRDTDPFWSMFNISPFTFAPWKVVWREVAQELDAAVVGKDEVGAMKKPVVPDHTCILVECESAEEAHYLCATVNSSAARLAIRNYIVLHPDPHVLNNINVPKFSKGNRTHARLAELSLAAHKATAKGDTAEVKKIEAEIDRTAARMWGLTDRDLAEIKRSLEEV